MSEPVPPAAPSRVWPVFAVYAALLVWLVVANLALFALAPGGLESLAAGGPVVSPGVLVASFAVNSASLAGAAMLAAGSSPAVRLRAGPGRLSAANVGLATLGLLAVSQLSDSLLALLGLQESGALGFLSQAVARMSGPMLGLTLLVGGVLAPAAEEVFFRGFMQTRLVARWGAPRAIGVTATAFGLIHFDPVHGAFALVVGLFLGWVTELAGSIRPAIAAHAVNNVASFGQAAWWRTPVTAPAHAGLAAIHLVLALVVIFALARGRRPAV